MYFSETEMSQNNFNTFKVLAKDLEVKGFYVPDEPLEDKTPASLLSQNLENTNDAEDLLNNHIKDNNLFPNEQTISVEDGKRNDDEALDIPNIGPVELTNYQFVHNHIMLM